MKQNKKKICFLSTDWNDNEYRRTKNQYGGVSYYRLVKPMELLKEKYDVKFFGSDIQKVSKGMSNDAFYDYLTSEYDMIIVKQIDNATACQALLHWCTKNGCILVQDYDDNMLMVRGDQPASKMGYQIGGQRRAYAGAMMSLADALIVSTEPLKEYFSKFIKSMYNEDKDIYIFPNFNDIKDWKYKQPKKDPNKVVIGWAGSITHDADLKLVMPTIGKLLDKYDHVYSEFLGGILAGQIGWLTEGWTEKAKKKFRIILGTPAWDKYPLKMMEQSWDIGIAPLIDDEFNKSKSHIKWMEYTMMGIPTIASDVYPYSNAIEHNVTGLLAKTVEDWEKQLTDLIEHPEERARLASQSMKHIAETQQWKQHENEYVTIVDNIFDKFANK